VSIFQELTAKSWATDQGKVDDLYAGRASSGLAKKLALKVFLAVVAVLFMLLVTAYGGRMAYEDWRPAPQISLLAGGAFTVVFLFGQVLAWRQLGAMVYFEVSNPAIAFFYLITGLHGLHLLGGLVAWGRTVVKVWGNFDVAKVRQSVELCTVYWHFLLLVWLVLFGLLFTGNNLDILLKLCGIR
jgi:cytochrome c oxidase subunit 3